MYQSFITTVTTVTSYFATYPIRACARTRACARAHVSVCKNVVTVVTVVAVAANPLAETTCGRRGVGLLLPPLPSNTPEYVIQRRFSGILGHSHNLWQITKYLTSTSKGETDGFEIDGDNATRAALDCRSGIGPITTRRSLATRRALRHGSFAGRPRGDSGVAAGNGGVPCDNRGTGIANITKTAAHSPLQLSRASASALIHRP